MMKELANLKIPNTSNIVIPLCQAGSAIAGSFAKYRARKQEAAARVVEATAPAVGEVSENLVTYMSTQNHDHIAMILENDTYTVEEKIRLEEETARIKAEEHEKKWNTFQQHIFPCIFLTGAAIGTGFIAHRCIGLGMEAHKEIALKNLNLQNTELKNQATKIRWTAFENILNRAK